MYILYYYFFKIHTSMLWYYYYQHIYVCIWKMIAIIKKLKEGWNKSTQITYVSRGNYFQWNVITDGGF